MPSLKKTRRRIHMHAYTHSAGCMSIKQIQPTSQRNCPTVHHFIITSSTRRRSTLKPARAASLKPRVMTASTAARTPERLAWARVESRLALSSVTIWFLNCPSARLRTARSGSPWEKKALLMSNPTFSAASLISDGICRAQLVTSVWLLCPDCCSCTFGANVSI